MALKLNSSLSLLPSTLSPNLSSNSSSSSPFLFSPTHFQSKTKIIPFLQNHCPMKSARRRAGVLLHPTSFRGPHGIGDLGEEAGCSLWQVIPLVPPGRKANEEGSPYSGQDANCGNTLLISVEELVKDGLLRKEELPKPVDSERVNYSTVAGIKDPLITKAAERLIRSEGELKSQLEAFHTDPDISSEISILRTNNCILHFNCYMKWDFLSSCALIVSYILCCC
ncbi:4-alpha-glucanotransferase [Pyrus ussuriensis x Pyrus communis]|uniref:4-alpha-glucanotransferase n=1 Tax=Pyrus ussuriensis x Pyrus communis TaxID=2448454 RepID=A0A5N5FFW8_9ROSA|nr:4-alpha-glucanotransferase [Pyrus ussuriensis x Pyrus communis]